MVGQGDAVRNFNGKDEIVRNGLGLLLYNRRFRHHRRIAAKQRPEPLVNLDRVVVPAVFPEIIEGFMCRVDHALPGIILPGTCTNVQVMFVHGIKVRLEWAPDKYSQSKFFRVHRFWAKIVTLPQH